MMAPRGFDRYMVRIGAGRNRKFVRFTDSERCAHFLGVLSIAAQAPIRGYLLVAIGREAGPEEIANEAGGGVTVRVARTAVEKLSQVGVLERDEDVGAWRVHHWDDLNPSPGAERTRRWRDTQASHIASPTRHASVTNPSPEVEGEEEEEKGDTPLTPQNDRAAVIECFEYWRERTAHKQAKLTAGREKKVRARLKEGYGVAEIRKGIDGAALNPPRDRDSGVVHDDLVSVCRNGDQLERYMARASARSNMISIERQSSARSLEEMSPGERASVERAQARLRGADGEKPA